MLRRRTVAWGNLAGLVTFSMMSTLVFVLTLYFEETLDLSAFRTGLIFGVAGVLSAVAGAYASKVIGRFGARRTLVGSLVGQGVLTGALLCVNADEVCRGLLTANAPLGVNCCSNVTTLAESLTTETAAGLAMRTLPIYR